MDRKSSGKSTQQKPLLLSDGFRNWGFWALIAVGLLIIVSFFTWWAKRGEQTYSVTPGKTTPASRTTGGSVATEYIKPDVTRGITQPDLETPPVMVGMSEIEQTNAIPELGWDDPTSQIGQVVFTKGQVQQVIAPNMFRLKVAAEREDSILIVYQTADLVGIAPAAGQTAIVRGTVAILDQDGIEELIDPLYLSEELKIVDFAGKLAIIASPVSE